MDIIVLISLAVLILILSIVVVVQSLRLQKLHQDLGRSQHAAPKVTISQPNADQLQARLIAAYDTEITKSVAAFGADLQGTSKQLTEQVSRLTTKVIEEELEAYQKTLEEVRQVAIQAMNQIREAVEHQRIELRQGMEQELATERQHLVEKFDAKMGDVISSYISEALGSGVDLGAQMQFILTSLEAHKADIRKDLTDGV